MRVWVSALAVCFALFAITACSSESPHESAKRSQDVLAEYGRSGHIEPVVSWLGQQEAQGQLRAAEQIRDWGLKHPTKLPTLLDQIPEQWDGRLVPTLAGSIQADGKSFVYIEQFAQNKGIGIQALVAAVKTIEQQDQRMPVLEYHRGKDSPLRGIARLKGDSGDQSWVGGAVLVAQSHCRMALLTAGHNVFAVDGGLRIPLEQFAVTFNGHEALTVAEVLPASAPAVRDPKQDWAVLLVTKFYCGKIYSDAVFDLAPAFHVPQEGVAATLYCPHQGGKDVTHRLYGEVCRFYDTGDHVLGHYSDKMGESLGIHSCISEVGSSGCPLIVEVEGQNYLAAVQIEGDRLTGAGIVRRLSPDILNVLLEIKTAFVAEDDSYRGDLPTLYKRPNHSDISSAEL